MFDWLDAWGWERWAPRWLRRTSYHAHNLIFLTILRRGGIRQSLCSRAYAHRWRVWLWLMGREHSRRSFRHYHGGRNART